MALFDAFDSWRSSDFAAFAATKWRSNRFNVERSQVRDRLRSLLEQALQRSGVNHEGLELWTSRHEPNFFNGHEVRDQWALLIRPEPEREHIEVRDGTVTAARPQDHHAHLGVQIDETGVRGWLRIPAGALWDQPGWRQQMDALAMLSSVEPLRLTLGGQAATLEALEAAASQPDPVEVAILWAQTAEQAEAGAAGLDDLAMWLSVAVPVLRLMLVAAPEAAVLPAAPEPPATVSESATPVTKPTPAAAQQAEPRQWQRYRPPPVERKERPESPRQDTLERLVPPALRAQLQREVEQEQARERALEETRRREAEWRARGPHDRHPQDRYPQDRPLHGQSANPPMPAGNRPIQPQQPPAPPQVYPRPGLYGPAAPPQPLQTAAQRFGPHDRHDGPQQPGQRRTDDRGGQHRPPHEGRRPDASGPPQRQDFAGTPRLGGRPFEVRDAAPAPAVTTLAPGAKVILQSGLFAGKPATLTELHGDQAQVHLGLMSVRVPLASLKLA